MSEFSLFSDSRHSTQGLKRNFNPCVDDQQRAQYLYLRHLLRCCEEPRDAQKDHDEIREQGGCLQDTNLSWSFGSFSSAICAMVWMEEPVDIVNRMSKPSETSQSNSSSRRTLR